MPNPRRTTMGLLGEAALIKGGGNFVKVGEFCRRPV